MKQNKRFILLVVMVLLANCLFAGLATAASYTPTVTDFTLPGTAVFTYDKSEIDPYGTVYAGYKAISLDLWAYGEPGYHNEGRAIVGGWTPNSKIDNDGWCAVFERDESGNAIDFTAFKFKAVSSDPTVVSVGTANATAMTEASWTLNAQKVGKATITITAYTLEDMEWSRSNPTGMSASFDVEIRQDVAAKVALTKKPTAANYKVGDSITAVLASSSMMEAAVKYNYDAFYGTNDILAFIYGTGLDYYYVPGWAKDIISVPTEWKLATDKDPWTEFDYEYHGDRYTPSKYKQITLSEYDWSGIIKVKFTDLAWSVSPADAADVVVTADKATITFKKAGNVTIKAAMAADPTINATVTYTIDKNPDIPEETLKLQTADGKTSATVKLIKGETPATLTLSAKDKDGKAVEIYKFKSSNTKVATIDEKTGVVTVKGEGTVQMTGTTKAGDTYYFNLKVKKVPVSKLTVTTKSIKVEVGKTAQIAWATKPAYAYNPAVKFKSSDKKIATVSDTGLVTGVKAGKTTVVVTPKFAKDTVNPVTIKVTVK
jgi:hypothetical protein